MKDDAPTEQYSLAEHVTCRKTNAELRMLFDRQRGVMYELNESASAIVEVLENGARSSRQITDALMEFFEGSDDEIAQDVNCILQDFEHAGLIVRQ